MIVLLRCFDSNRELLIGAEDEILSMRKWIVYILENGRIVTRCLKEISALTCKWEFIA